MTELSLVDAKQKKLQLKNTRKAMLLNYEKEYEDLVRKYFISRVMKSNKISTHISLTDFFMDSSISEPDDNKFKFNFGDKVEATIRLLFEQRGYSVYRTTQFDDCTTFIISIESSKCQII